MLIFSPAITSQLAKPVNSRSQICFVRNRRLRNMCFLILVSRAQPPLQQSPLAAGPGDGFLERLIWSELSIPLISIRCWCCCFCCVHGFSPSEGRAGSDRGAFSTVDQPDIRGSSRIIV